ncbi:hypothetical protein NKH18_20795 [Streptomyces sp. M10(2022)]
MVEDLNRISSALVRPYTGIFRGYEDERLTQTPLKISRVEVALGAGCGAGSPRSTCTISRARGCVRCTRRRRCTSSMWCRSKWPTGMRRASLVRAGKADHRGGTGVLPGAWTTATSLTGKDPVRVPAAAVRTFGAYNRDRLHLATAAGSGRAAARRRPPGAVCCRRSRTTRWYGPAGTTVVSPVASDGTDPELVFLLKSAVNLDTAVELLDLGEGSAPRPGGARPRGERRGDTGALGGGCRSSLRAAACDALRDLLGQVQLAAEDPGAEVDLGDPIVGDLAAGTVLVSGAPVLADGAGTTFDAVLDRLRDTGRDALYVPTTPADLPAGGISTARVLLTLNSGTPDGEGGPDAR